MWGALHHPNVLPLLGATATGAEFAMVSEWMANGNINEYIKAHPGADRLGLVGPPSEIILPRSLLISPRLP